MNLLKLVELLRAAARPILHMQTTQSAPHADCAANAASLHLRSKQMRRPSQVKLSLVLAGPQAISLTERPIVQTLSQPLKTLMLNTKADGAMQYRATQPATQTSVQL